MRGFRYFFGSVFLTAVLAVPAALSTAGMPQDNEHQDRRRDNNAHRYYDRQHKDYHNWDGNEDQYYRRYLGERHRDYRPFERSNRREQREYWNWRHQQEHEQR